MTASHALYRHKKQIVIDGKNKICYHFISLIFRLHGAFTKHDNVKLYGQPISLVCRYKGLAALQIQLHLYSHPTFKALAGHIFSLKISL